MSDFRLLTNCTNFPLACFCPKLSFSCSDGWGDALKTRNVQMEEEEAGGNPARAGCPGVTGKVLCVGFCPLGVPESCPSLSEQTPKTLWAGFSLWFKMGVIIITMFTQNWEAPIINRSTQPPGVEHQVPRGATHTRSLFQWTDGPQRPAALCPLYKEEARPERRRSVLNPGHPPDLHSKALDGCNLWWWPSGVLPFFVFGHAGQHVRSSFPN